jgi:ribosomal protein L3 glutamine methyltransferase
VAFGHGTANAFDEAAWLVLWRLKLPLDDIDAVADRTVSPADAGKVAALLDERIATRKPAAYLTKEAWLQGVPFYVDERAIVPRSFIAELMADGSIDYWLGEHTQRVLDLCTGNGSLAVLAALAYPDVTGGCGRPVGRGARSGGHQRHPPRAGGPRPLVESDGLAALPGPYDLVLCNPPYVNSESMAALPAEYRAEPELALAGGADGMDFVRRLFADAPSRMSEQACWCWKSATSAITSRPRSRSWKWCGWKPRAGEDQVLLVTREPALLAVPARVSCARPSPFFIGASPLSQPRLRSPFIGWCPLCPFAPAAKGWTG